MKKKQPTAFADLNFKVLARGEEVSAGGGDEEVKGERSAPLPKLERQSRPGQQRFRC